MLEKGPPKDLDKIENLKNKLYSPNQSFSVKNRKIIHKKEHETQNDWDDGKLEDKLKEYKPKKRINFFGIMLIFAAIFFVGALGYASLTFFGGSQVVSGNDVDISVIGPISIGGGDELVLDIIVQNNNQIQLETVDVVIEYPNGTKKADDLKTDLPRLREGLGIVAPNSVVRKTYSAALFGEEGSEEEIEVRVEYRLPGSSAIFEKSKIFSVVLQSSPIRLTVDTVKEITPNQELIFNVALTSNSNQVLSDVLLVADYPFGFTLEDSTFATSLGDNVWYFEKIDPQEKIELQIKGRLEGQNNEERVFDFSAGIQDSEIKNELGVVFTSLPRAINISRPFFELNLAIDGDSKTNLVKVGAQQMEGRLLFTNNTNSNIQNAQVILTLTGDVLDESSVSVSDGFYRSQDNTIIWNSSTDDSLEEISAGESGGFSFSFRTESLASKSAVFKNPEIVLDAVATGRRVSEESVSEEIKSTTFKRLQFVSNVIVRTESKSINGPIPPAVDQETTYDIDLSVLNSSNTVNNSRMTTILPNYVKWNNVVSAGSAISFDPVSRLVEWNIGNLDPHAGYTTAKKSASFQVVLTPSISQVGNSPALTGNINFSGSDEFTKTAVETVSVPATTNVETGDSFFDSRVVK